MKKKAKKKATGKKAAKRSNPRKGKTETNPAEVRKAVSKMVEAEAEEMAVAVIGEGKKGQLATVRYLFEMANIFPAEKEEDRTSENEDCLAQTLLRRLDLPDEPIARDEDDELVPVPAKGEKGVEEKKAGQESAEEVPVLG